MRKILILMVVGITNIGIAHAQWHFSLTNISYNDFCNGLGYTQAELQVSIRVTMARENAAKTYETREECERFRSMATMNYTNGGCYIRTTTSPCTGGNTGGGGTGGTGGVTGSGFGSFQGNTSLYSSTVIGEPFFAPNEAYVVSSMGEDLETKLAALNKSFNDAVGGRGIKTGDGTFDDHYKSQVNDLPRNGKKSERGEYTFYPRIDKVYLDKENSYVHDDDELVVPIDPERVKQQELDERIEKGQKEMQHRLDSIDKINQKKMDSINKSQNKPNVFVSDNESEDKRIDEPSLGVALIESYQVGSAFVQNADKELRYINETLGVSIPGSKQISELNSTLNDLETGVKELQDWAIVIVDGDISRFTEKLKTYATNAVAIAVDPYLDKVAESVKTLTNKYTKTTDIISDVGNPLKKAVGRFTNTILEGALKAEKTGEYDGYGRSVYKEASRFNGKLVEMTEKQIYKN